MKELNRRKFIRHSAQALGSAWLLSQLPFNAEAESFYAENKLPLGFQTFPIRNILSKDIPGTFKLMADLGYQTVEMCSPSGYAGFGWTIE